MRAGTSLHLLSRHIFFVRRDRPFMPERIAQQARSLSIELVGRLANHCGARLGSLPHHVIDAIHMQLRRLAEKHRRPVTVEAIDFAGHGFPGGLSVGLANIRAHPA